MYIDIEVEVTDGFPNPSSASNKITSIALYDSIMEQYKCFVLDESSKLNTDFGNDVIIETFTNEEDLLNRFMASYLEITPTIISGWNVDKFDMPYLYNRITLVLGQDIADCLSPIRQIHWSKYYSKYKIAGVSVLDYLNLYKNFVFTSKTSYRLDSIAEEELGEKKIEYEGTLNDLYENDLEKFVKYNIHDVRLVKKLDDKLDFINIARAVCHVGHVPYEDVYMSSRYLEGAILVYLRKLGIVAPNKDPKGKNLMGMEDKFAGAYVQDPQRGKHDWVYDLDITSMYPSCIMSLNISPETKIGKVEGWDAEEYLRGDNKTYTIIKDRKEIGKLTEKELKDYLDNNKVSISTNGVLYKLDRKGLIPALLESWFDKRLEYRKLMKKFGDAGEEDKYQYFQRRQHIQKIILNSLYGVLGLPVFRFYDLDNAEATTLTGQTLIKFTKKMANFYYNKELRTDDKDYCIYIDTDSVFYSAIPLIEKRFPNQNMSDVMMTQRITEIASEVQSFINKSYDYFSKRMCNLHSNHRFEIKQEIIAKSGLFIVKKRYGMKIISDNGVKVNKILVKGIDTVRSNFPIALRKFLADVLEDILTDVPKDKIDDRISDFKNGMKKMKLDTIAIPTGVKGITKYTDRNASLDSSSIFTTFRKGAPVHVKASISYNDLVKYFKLSNKYDFISNGEKIKWVYLKNNNFGLDTVAYKGHEDPPQILKFIREHVDFDKIYTAVLKKKIKMFYDSMGWGQHVDKGESIERFF